MKDITVSVDDDLYDAFRMEADKQRKSLNELVGEFLRRLAVPTHEEESSQNGDSHWDELWALADSKPKRAGSLGPLNREELHDRGFSRH